MSKNWSARLGRNLGKLFSWQTPAGCVDFTDRDAERMACELELIKLRFPHHS